ncbi:putative sporulation protein YtxC [Oceanobacillus sp. CFH 90083]|uniref:putative sporulation protein YtxC n=1 Tax=Oceanobacillus sp. CFH 90083 TaxID=2592336 RepID=UPI001D141FC9|nr:putative sporulation protein YtxC [Oceanobacillus sp. CFH 90083]
MYFESDKEVSVFRNQLSPYRKQIRVHQQANAMWGNRLRLEGDAAELELIDIISSVMADVFIEVHLSDIIIRGITDKYYFSDPDEINRIYDFTMWILFETDSDNQYLRDHVDTRKLLQHIFFLHVKEHRSIHFSAILHFRLSHFLDFVHECIGKAIEEFKREEDHQTFMDMLRHYIENKEHCVDLVHIEQGENFTFYNEKGEVISKDMLRFWMYQAPLYALGLHENEFNLSPLIAMSPARIKVYGNDLADPKTMTIINIFQERVQFERKGISILSNLD